MNARYPHRLSLLLLLAVAAASADTLTVSGQVNRPGPNPIAGATITVSVVAVGGGLTSQQTTTDTSGNYTATLDNSAGARTVLVSATAPGYNPGQASARVASPSDDVADTVVRDLQLQPVVHDTISIAGIVVDSAGATPLQGARVILRYLTVEVDTVITAAAGTVVHTITTTQQVPQVSWVVEADGYRTVRGSATATSNAVDLDTVRMAAYAAGDTLLYTVGGLITDDVGAGLRGDTVIVTIRSGAQVLASDTVTVTGNDGSYQAQLRLAYQAGTVTVGIAVLDTAYLPFSKSIDVASSTTEVTLDGALQQQLSVMSARRAMRMQGLSGPVAVYALNGRLLCTIHTAEQLPAVLRSLRARLGGQALVLRDAQGVGVSAQMMQR